jgi:hypothetical protein
MAAEANNSNDGKAAHFAWRNYDDFNEYFWSRSCFKLSWPPAEGSSFYASLLRGSVQGRPILLSIAHFCICIAAFIACGFFYY